MHNIILLLTFGFLPFFEKDNLQLPEQGYRKVTVFASDKGGFSHPDSINTLKLNIKAAFLLKSNPPRIEYMEMETPATIKVRPDFSYGFISKNMGDGVMTAFVKGDEMNVPGFGMQGGAIFIDNSGDQILDLEITGYNEASTENKADDGSDLSEQIAQREITICGSNGDVSSGNGEPKLAIPFKAAVFTKNNPPSIKYVEGMTPFKFEVESDFHYAFFSTSSDSNYLMILMYGLIHNEYREGTGSEGKAVFINNTDDSLSMTGYW
jgi:hypothetical protein